MTAARSPGATDLDLDAKRAQAAAWLQQSLLNHAEISLRQVLAARPGDVLARRLHGIALFKLGRRDDGLDALDAAARGDPLNPRAWADLAVALRDDGQTDAASDAYAQALAAQPVGISAPPLAEQAFCTELARHDFRIVDYAYRAEIRYGAGRPAHPELFALIDRGRERYRALLNRLGELHAYFAQVPHGGTYESAEPFWFNAWYSPLDAMALTAMLRDGDPAQFVEIGSGVSTKFARRAVNAFGLRTRLTSIDPEPRNAVDRLCDAVIRKPLERCDLAVFAGLEPGDIVFLDSSHRSFQGSDVTVFFLEILPRLKPGVIVHIHDIYLPYDYISGHVPRLWNEQYLLATALLFGPERFEVLFPSWFVRQDADLAAHAATLLRHGALEEVDLYGASFWMRIV
jgi:tetratricopeptide (TPR) repeat protein